MQDEANPAHGEHELSDEQDAELKSCANHAIAWGAVCVVAAVACFALATPALAHRGAGGAWRPYVAAGALNLALGVNFVRAGREFRGAVYTRGRDISHVVHGLSHLSSAVLVQIVLAFVTIAFVLVTGAFLGGGR